PTLLDLEGDFPGLNGYQFSYTIIEYAVHEFGMDAVVALILAPNDFEAAFGEGVTMEQFEAGWMQFLRDRYAG
ncbi:MAG: hypothetical protein JSW34_01145, partial [Candidatus Zixiibacteriota bacterium]